MSDTGADTSSSFPTDQGQDRTTSSTPADTNGTSSSNPEQDPASTTTTTAAAAASSFSEDSDDDSNSTTTTTTSDKDDDDDEKDQPNETDPNTALLKAINLKTEGNNHFSAGNLTHAARSYRKGTSLLKPLNHSNTGDAQVKSLLLNLQTNLSMVCYKQEKHHQAVKVATCALEVEEGNVKALYRRAMALRKLGDLEGAKKDLKVALGCEGGNIKVIQKEWQSVKAELEQLKKKKKAALSKAFSSKGGSFLYEDKEEEEKRKEMAKKAKEEAEKVALQKRKQDWEDECVKRLADGNEAISFDDYEKELKAKEKEEEKARKKAKKEEEEKRAAQRRAAKAASKKDESDDDDHDELTESEMKMFRGYKKTSDGRTTSYFTREQTEEEKKLLGSIAPQKLSSPPKLDSHVSPQSNTAPNSASAWNQAGTWEEKNTSEWCNSSLEKHLKETRVEMNSLTASISEVKDLTGDASVVTVSGKKRYVFDFNSNLKYKIRNREDDTVGSGTFNLPEISSTSIDDELEVVVTKWKKSHEDTDDITTKSLLQCRDALIKQIRIQIAAFVSSFNAQF